VNLCDAITPQLLMVPGNTGYFGGVAGQHSDCRKIEPHILAVCVLAGKVWGKALYVKLSVFTFAAVGIEQLRGREDLFRGLVLHHGIRHRKLIQQSQKFADGPL